MSFGLCRYIFVIHADLRCIRRIGICHLKLTVCIFERLHTLIYVVIEWLVNVYLTSKMTEYTCSLLLKIWKYTRNVADLYLLLEEQEYEEFVKGIFQGFS